MSRSRAVRAGARVELPLPFDERLTELRLRLGDQPFSGTGWPLEAPAENPTSFVADAPPGRQDLTVSAEWDPGQAQFYAALDIR